MKMKDPEQVLSRNSMGSVEAVSALSGADNSHANYDGKGLFLAKRVLMGIHIRQFIEKC